MAKFTNTSDDATAVGAAALILLLIVSLGFGFTWLITEFGTHPLLEALSGKEIPFWPTFIVTALVNGGIAIRTNPKQ